MDVSTLPNPNDEHEATLLAQGMDDSVVADPTVAPLKGQP